MPFDWTRFPRMTVAVLALADSAWAQQPADLTKVDIEDLMNVKVTSVSKKEQQLSRTAAAPAPPASPICCVWLLVSTWSKSTPTRGPSASGASTRAIPARFWS
jgi:hypothetical protein